MPGNVRSERGLDRLVNFSDAVVAIAITLLVLPLAQLVGEAQQTSAFSVVSAHGDQFVAFALTFVVTTIYWFRHHGMFEQVGSYDMGLMWLNMAWLFFVVLLPFSSGLVGEFGFRAGNGVFYSLTMAFLSLFLGLMGVHLRRRSHLLRPGVGPADIKIVKAWVYTGYFLALALVSVPWPEAAPWLLLGLIPLGRLTENR